MAPTGRRTAARYCSAPIRKGERDVYRKDSAANRPETLVFASPESKSVNAWSPDGGSSSTTPAPRARMTRRAAPTGLSPHRGARRRTAHAPVGVDAGARGDCRHLARWDARRVSLIGSRRHRGLRRNVPGQAGTLAGDDNGAIEPLWSANGKELFFLTNHDEVASVEVFRTADGVRFGPQRVLFTRPMGPVDQVRSYAPFPDGQRFLLLTAATAPATQQLTVRVNWRLALPDD